MKLSISNLRMSFNSTYVATQAHFHHGDLVWLSSQKSTETAKRDFLGVLLGTHPEILLNFLSVYKSESMNMMLRVCDDSPLILSI